MALDESAARARLIDVVWRVELIAARHGRLMMGRWDEGRHKAEEGIVEIGTRMPVRAKEGSLKEEIRKI